MAGRTPAPLQYHALSYTRMGDIERAVTLARSAIVRRDPGVFALPGGVAEDALRSLDVWPELESAMRLPKSATLGRTG